MVQGNFIKGRSGLWGMQGRMNQQQRDLGSHSSKSTCHEHKMNKQISVSTQNEQSGADLMAAANTWGVSSLL